MARHDDRRAAQTNACRGDRPAVLRGAAARAGLGGDRPLRRPAIAARQILADRDLGDDFSRLDADAVTGDRIGDAGVLRPRRSRPHHVLARDAGQSVLGRNAAIPLTLTVIALLFSTPFFHVLGFGGGPPRPATVGSVGALGPAARSGPDGV